MNNGYGKIFLLLTAIGLILLATSGRGRAVWQALTGNFSLSGSPASQPFRESNPTDLRPKESQPKPKSPLNPTSPGFNPYEPA